MTQEHIKECPECGGDGEIEYESMYATNPDTGRIRYYTEYLTCDVCRGEGEVVVEEEEEE